MIAQVHMSYSFSNMLQCLLIDGGSGNMIESKRDIYIIDIIQKMVKAQVIVSGDARTIFFEPKIISLIAETFQFSI